VASRQLLFLVLLTAACVYAAVRGGHPERIGAGGYVAGSALSVIAAHPLHGRFIHTDLGIFAVDLGMLVLFIWLSLRSTRFWPIWVAAVLAAEAMVHVMRALAPHAMPLAYLKAQALWGWMAIFLLSGATWRHRARLRDGIHDPDWKKG
jgi:hypothetical protein